MNRREFLKLIPMVIGGVIILPIKNTLEFYEKSDKLPRQPEILEGEIYIPSDDPQIVVTIGRTITDGVPWDSKLFKIGYIYWAITTDDKYYFSENLGRYWHNVRKDSALKYFEYMEIDASKT